MPLQIQAQIRFNEAARETLGLIKTVNSVAMTQLLAKEAAGAPKITPAGFIVSEGQKITPNPAGQP